MPRPGITPSMNILVTGSPGVGKSRFAEALREQLAAMGRQYTILNVSQLVKDEQLYDEYDARLDTLIMKDSAVRKRLKQLLCHEESNIIVETHTISILPRKLIDHTFVLRIPTTSIYYDRLAARGYPDAKIQENLDCEIMQVVWMEAVEELGGEEDVTVLQSETEANLAEALQEAIQVLQEK